MLASPLDPHSSSTLLSGRDRDRDVPPKEGAVRTVRGVLPPDGEAHGLPEAEGCEACEATCRAETPRRVRGFTSDAARMLRGVPAGEVQGIEAGRVPLVLHSGGLAMDPPDPPDFIASREGEALGEALGDAWGEDRGVEERGVKGRGVEALGIPALTP